MAKKIDYTPLAKELKKHIEIMESTFAANNLQVINIGCQDVFDGDLLVYVELATISETVLPNDISIKINLYDENGDIYMVGSHYVDKESFSGYDTITINCFDKSRVLEKAVKGRLFATRR